MFWFLWFDLTFSLLFYYCGYLDRPNGRRDKEFWENQKDIYDFYGNCIWFSLLRIPERPLWRSHGRGEPLVDWMRVSHRIFGAKPFEAWQSEEKSGKNPFTSNKGHFIMTLVPFSWSFPQSTPVYVFLHLFTIHCVHWWTKRRKGPSVSIFFFLHKRRKELFITLIENIERNIFVTLLYVFNVIDTHEQYIKMGSFTAKCSICREYAESKYIFL